MKALPVAGIGRLVSKKAEIVGPAQRRLRHEAQRLTAIDTFQKRDFLGPRDDAVGNPIHDSTAFRAVHIAPGGKGIGGRPGGIINIRSIPPRHRRNPGHIDGRDAFKRLARPRRTIPPTNMIEDRLGTKGGQEAFRLFKIFSLKVAGRGPGSSTRLTLLSTVI